MQFDTVLNLIWLLLGLVALASTVRTDWYRSQLKSRGQQWLHLVGVGLIVAALFPYISATDDVLRIESLNNQLHRNHSAPQTGQKKQNEDLIRLYETLDSPLIVPLNQVALTFCFIAWVPLLFACAISRHEPLHAGRSPPPSLQVALT